MIIIIIIIINTLIDVQEIDTIVRFGDAYQTVRAVESRSCLDLGMDDSRNEPMIESL